MLRRVALGVLAAPMLIRPTLAQTQSPSRNESGQGVVSSQSAPANDTQAQMLGGMAFALATAQLGERQGENPAIRSFAQLEVEEQTAFTTARQMAGLRVPTVELMTENQRQMMMHMRDLRGAQFDQMFLQGQLQGHQELLRLNQAAAQNPPSREEGLLATVAVPSIRTHLVVLQGVQQSMRG